MPVLQWKVSLFTCLLQIDWMFTNLDRLDINYVHANSEVFVYDWYMPGRKEQGCLIENFKLCFFIQKGEGQRGRKKQNGKKKAPLHNNTLNTKLNNTL